METVNHEAIRQLLASVNTEIDPSLLKPAQMLSDFGYDSLDKIGIVIALEEKYSLPISDTDGLKLVSVEAIMAYINERLRQG